MSWPNDADGDVLRRLELDGFDFSKEHEVDFNIDFERWPPPNLVMEELKEKFENIKVIEPDEEDLEEVELNGYVMLTVTSKVSYEFVTKMQAKLISLVRIHGGWCNSWGVFCD